MPACASARCSGSVAYPVRASTRISPAGVPPASASADLRTSPSSPRANSFGKVRTRTRPPGPRIAISAFAGPSVRCGSRTRPRRRGSPRGERKFRPSTISRLRGVPLAEAEDVPRLGWRQPWISWSSSPHTHRFPSGPASRSTSVACAWLVSWNSSTRIQRHRWRSHASRCGCSESSRTANARRSSNSNALRAPQLDARSRATRAATSGAAGCLAERS